jgi:hypothetical protein
MQNGGKEYIYKYIEQRKILENFKIYVKTLDIKGGGCYNEENTDKKIFFCLLGVEKRKFFVKEYITL